MVPALLLHEVLYCNVTHGSQIDYQGYICLMFRWGHLWGNNFDVFKILPINNHQWRNTFGLKLQTSFICQLSTPKCIVYFMLFLQPFNFLLVFDWLDVVFFRVPAHMKFGCKNLDNETFQKSWNKNPWLFLRKNSVMVMSACEQVIFIVLSQFGS